MHVTTTRTAIPKQKLIETAAILVFRQGWNATGINQILTDADVPKGSFYYYFQSKDDLGVALVKFHADDAENIYRETLLNENLSGYDALQNFFAVVIERRRRQGWRWGCPVGSICNEVADTTEKIASEAREALGRFRDAVAVAVRRGQADASITTRRPVEEVSWFVVELWQGAQLCMKAMRSEEPLGRAVDMVNHVLIAPQ